MRVLHLFDPAVARPTDYGRRARALLGALRAQGVHTVHVAAPAGGHERPAIGPAAARPDDWPHDSLHLYRACAAHRPAWVPARCGALYSGAALALRLRRLSRLTRPDVMHVHSAAHACAAWAAARLARIPLVVEAERRIAGLGRGARFACARADALATTSVDMRRELRAALGAGGACPRHIAVLPLASDVPAAPCVDPGPAGLEGAPLLAYAGRLERVDGIDLLLAVVGALRRRHPALRLLVAGGGAPVEALEARVTGSSLRGHVLFTGPLCGRRAADALARADIAVFPGLAGSAAALAPSRHVLNAMAQGCAVVASDLAGHRELLVHGHSGMLFPAGSATALLAVLTQLLDERYRLRPLGRAAAAHVGRHHDWAAAAARYRRLYEHVAARGR